MSTFATFDLPSVPEEDNYWLSDACAKSIAESERELLEWFKTHPREVARMFFQEAKKRWYSR